jgi:uncharacterized repeat protein (TIGR02543 family)
MGDFLFDSATAVTADVVFAAPDISAFRVAIEIDSSVTPPSLSPDVSTQTIDQYGTIATITFANSGGAVDSYSYPDLPVGLSFDPIAGKLSGKLTEFQGLPVSFGITAMNAGGSSMSSTLIDFNPTNQTITFNQPSDMNLGDSDQTLSATTSSGLRSFVFRSSNDGICTVFKGLVTTVSTGICTTTADERGDSIYLAAPQVTVSFTIYPVGGPPSPAPTPSRTITYALGGGSGTLPTHIDVAEGNGFTLAVGVGLTRTGYTFNKWNDGTSDFSAASIYTVSTSNVVLTATWTANLPGPTPAPTPAPVQTPTPIQTPTPAPIAPITPTISTLVFTENLLKNGGTLSWTGTNIESWRFIGDEKTYPTPFIYGTYTVNWTGNLVNMVTGVKYSIAIEVLSKTSGSQSSSIDYTIEPAPVVIDTSAAEEAAKLKAEQEKAIDDAKAAEVKAIADAKAAEAKAVEDARIAAEAKAVEDARIAAEAKAVEDARIAAEAKVATDMKIAEDAAIKISKEKSEAEAQAIKDAANAALAAKRLVLKFSINMPVVKTYLNSETKALIKNYALTLPVNSNVTCIGYTYSSKPTKTELARAKNEALAACKYVVTIKKGTHYYISVKSWLAIKPKPKAMDTRKLHRLDILSSVPLTIEEIIDMQNLVALVRKDNEWVM